jgi:glycosyltransferase involved in cell wall biosynthesis
MRVAVNALHLVPGETGGLEIYARRLLPALAAADPSLELVVLASREGHAALAGDLAGSAEVVRVGVNARSRVRRVLAEQLLVPGAARGADLLHSLFNTAPALPGLPQVTTIHDLIYRHDPSPTVMTRGQAALLPLAAWRSRRVITVSEASKRDLVLHAHADPARVDVVPNGPGIDAVPDPVPPTEVRARLGIDGGRPLVLTVSPKVPHKNVGRLIDAVASLGDLHPVLVVPGYRKSEDDELERRAHSGGVDVRLLDWVPAAMLDGLYRAADAFAMPSLAEGFGLPVVEAMLRGTAVACSDATSLPEVGGDAALYFDPRDTDAIAAALRRLLTDAELRERLVAAGFEQARQFSWARAAEGTLASYRAALGGS